MRSSRTRSISGLPRESALPMTTRSGTGVEIRFGVRLEDGNAERAQQIAHGRIGGLVGAGDADGPATASRPASEAMAVPQMPMR